LIEQDKAKQYGNLQSISGINNLDSLQLQYLLGQQATGFGVNQNLSFNNLGLNPL